MRDKIYLLLLIIITATGFNGCIQFKTNDTGIWFYTYTSKGGPSEDILTPASFFCLQPDGNYTLDFGNFEYGKWQQYGDTIILNNASGNTRGLLIQNKSGNEIIISTEPGVISHFETQPYKFEETAAQPFSFQNNKWRIKANHKESENEIRARLKNHCLFWKEYFTWALDSHINTVDVRSTPTPIKIYGNGFEIKFFYDLPPQWKNYFFDSSDCQRANDILADMFRHKNIALAHTDNRFKMYIGAFEQMEQMLNKETN